MVKVAFEPGGVSWVTETGDSIQAAASGDGSGASTMPCAGTQAETPLLRIVTAKRADCPWTTSAGAVVDASSASSGLVRFQRSDSWVAKVFWVKPFDI